MHRLQRQYTGQLAAVVALQAAVRGAQHITSTGSNALLDCHPSSSQVPPAGAGTSSVNGLLSLPYKPWSEATSSNRNTGKLLLRSLFSKQCARIKHGSS